MRYHIILETYIRGYYIILHGVRVTTGDNIQSVA